MLKKKLNLKKMPERGLRRAVASFLATMNGIPPNNMTSAEFTLVKAVAENAPRSGGGAEARISSTNDEWR